MSGDLTFYNTDKKISISVTPRGGVHTAENILNIIRDQIGGDYTHSLISPSILNNCIINIKLVRNPYARTVSSFRWFHGHGNSVGVPLEKCKVSFEGYLQYLLENKNRLHEINHHFRPQNNGEEINNMCTVIKNDDIEYIKKRLVEVVNSKLNRHIDFSSLVAGGYEPQAIENPTEYVGDKEYGELVEKYGHNIKRKFFYNDETMSLVYTIFKEDFDVFGYDKYNDFIFAK